MKPETCCEARLSFVRRPGAGAEILRRFRVGEARHVEGGDGRSLPVSTLQRVAANLESAAEGRQLGKDRMTSGARLAGLAGVGRQRFGRLRSERERLGSAQKNREYWAETRGLCRGLEEIGHGGADRSRSHGIVLLLAAKLHNFQHAVRVGDLDVGGAAMRRLRVRRLS